VGLERRRREADGEEKEGESQVVGETVSESFGLSTGGMEIWL
jgi:hypothetical protein